jgi:hypothetical protein
LLLGPDHYASMSNERERQGNVVVDFPTLTEGFGGPGTSMRWYPDTLGLPVIASGNLTHAYARQDVTALYTTASNVTSFHQDTLHVKPTGLQDYLIRRHRLTTSVSHPVVSFAHLPLVDSYSTAAPTFCGTPASSSCLALSSGVASNIKGSARLNMKMVAVSSSQALLKTESGGTNFSYTNGVGWSGKLRMCPSSDGSTCLSATAHRWWEVYQPSANTATTMPTITSITSGAWDALQIEGSQPVVVVMNSAPSLTPVQTSMSVTTTHSATARYVVTDLTPAGTFTLSRNGTPVCSSVVASAAGVLECDSLSGAITVAASSGGGGGGTGTTTRGVTGQGVVVR